MVSKVTPYEVEGVVDYNHLVTEFGITPLTATDLQRIKKLAKGLHPYLRRGIFFAHRDLKWCLDEYEKGNKFFLYTGCGPSGTSLSTRRRTASRPTTRRCVPSWASPSCPASTSSVIST